MRLDEFLMHLLGEEAVQALDRAGIEIDGDVVVETRPKSVEIDRHQRINVPIPVVKAETRHAHGEKHYTVQREAEVWDRTTLRTRAPRRPTRNRRRRMLGADVGIETTELPAGTLPVEPRISWMGHTGEK